MPPTFKKKYFFQCQPFNNFFRQIKVGRKTLAAGFKKKKRKLDFKKKKSQIKKKLAWL